MIWKVSFNIFQSNPLTGIGNGTFGGHYIHSQYQLFLTNKTSWNLYQNLAGDVRFAFNDFLQFFCENGILGMLLFSSIIFKTFRQSLDIYAIEYNFVKVIRVSLLSSVIVLLIGGMFSYPLSLLPLKIVFWVMIACINSFAKTKDLTINIHKFFVSIVPILLIITASFLIYYGARRYYSFLKLSEINRNVNALNSSAALMKLYPILADHPSYLIILGKQLKNEQAYDKAIVVFKNAKQICPDPEIYYELGNVYCLVKQYDYAEKEYSFISIAIPSLLKPSYLLAKMYHESNQEEKFLKTAYEILNTKLKVESYETFFMKDQIRILLNKK